MSVKSKKTDAPLYSLKALRRIHLGPGEERLVEFEITPEMLSIVNESGERIFEKGTATLYLAGSLPGKRSEELGASTAMSIGISLK